MEFSDVATFFDTDPVTDGYTGASLWNAQVASFDDSSSDGATSRRRVLSIDPSLSIPARRCLTIYADRWIVGTGTPDGWAGDTVRRHFTMKRVTDLMAILTPGEALAASAGTPAYVQKTYFKDIVNALTDAEYDTQWNIFAAPDEPASKGKFLRAADSRLYRIRNDYLPLEGLRILQSDVLDVGASSSCVFATGAYNKVTEAVAAGTTTVTGIRVEIPKFYRFRHLSDEKVQPGDVAVFVPSSLALRQGMTFTMSSTTWRVEGFQTELDAQVVHARRA